MYSGFIVNLPNRGGSRYGHDSVEMPPFEQNTVIMTVDRPISQSVNTFLHLWLGAM